MVSTTIVIIKRRQTLEDLGMVLIDATSGLKSLDKRIKNICTSKTNENNAKLEATLTGNRYKERFYSDWMSYALQPRNTNICANVR